MGALYHYKLWNPNLGQFVAQSDRLPVDRIHAIGGLIIVDGSHAMSDTGVEHAGRLEPTAAPPLSEHLPAAAMS